jgi:hypothetical protein
MMADMEADRIIERVVEEALYAAAEMEGQAARPLTAALVALYVAAVAHYSLPVGCLESDWQSTGAEAERATAAVTAIIEGSET